jgi:phosphate transport system ATP-binding protein
MKSAKENIHVTHAHGRHPAPDTARHEPAPPPEPKIRVRNLNFFYGKHQALIDNNIDIHPNTVTAFIGPSGCGKSTHLRTYNRIYELYPGHKPQGQVLLDGKNMLEPGIDLLDLRRRVGMIFQKASPLPLSIYENIAYGVRIHYQLRRAELDERVEKSLRQAALWDEVKDKLRKPGTALSGGQQQRLCIARTVATEPEVLLMDEPCSDLDPISTGKIEDLMHELKKQFTVVIVTHNMHQAARVSDYTAVMYLGKMVEVGTTEQIFHRPQVQQTQDYILGRVG